MRKSMGTRPKWKTSTEYQEFDEQRERIIDCAREIIEEVGIGKLRLDEVAKRTGCVRQTIYRYFNSKKEISQAVLLHLTLQNAQEVMDHVKNIDSEEDLLVEMIYYGAKNLATDDRYKIITDNRNTTLFSGLSGETMDNFLNGYSFEKHNPLIKFVSTDINIKDLYLWLTMQVIALVNLGIINEKENKVRNFIRNMIVRGPIYKKSGTSN